MDSDPGNFNSVVYCKSSYTWLLELLVGDTGSAKCCCYWTCVKGWL